MSCYEKTPDCHSEPTFLDGLTKNPHEKVTFEILRGSVYASPSQNDISYYTLNVVYTVCNCIKENYGQVAVCPLKNKGQGKLEVCAEIKRGF